MLRARIRGVIVFECPNCFGYQKIRSQPLRGHVLECPECHHVFAYGLVLAKMPPCPRRGREPMDTILIEDGLWRSGARINQQLCTRCSHELFDEPLERERQRQEDRVRV